MSSTGWINCEPGRWTRIYQAPALLGVLHVSEINSGPVDVQWREYSAGIPFVNSGNLTVGRETLLVVGPSPWVELWINPQKPSRYRAT